MVRRQRQDGIEAKIVELSVVADQAEADALARYWDATVKGLPSGPDNLEPRLTVVVRLLRHYHHVTRLQQGAADTPLAASGGPLPGRTSPPVHRPAAHDCTRAGSPATTRPMTRVATAMVALFVVIFAINTLTSPRSWLLSAADDPDWIPWVSDDWLGPGAVTAQPFGIGSAELLSQDARRGDGA